MRIKKIFLIAVLTSFSTMAQVGIGTETPEGALDIVSNTSGLIVPRLANTAVVTTPVDGMLIYDLASNCLKTYENGAWSACLGAGNSAAEVLNDCDLDGFTFTGAPTNGIALDGGSFSVTLTNNSFSTATLTVEAADVVLSGISEGITVGAPSSPTVTLIAGQSQKVSYPITGTPTTSGDLIATWTSLSLTCTKTQAIGKGEAVFSTMPSPTPIVSVTGTTIQGVIDNADNAITLNIAYTEGLGGYDAYTSAVVTATGEADNNGFSISYPAGTYSTSGFITATVVVDGDGTFNVAKQAYEALTTIASLDFQVNGVSKGNIVLEAQGGVTSGDFVYTLVVVNGQTWLSNNLGADYANVNHASFAPNTQASSSTDAAAYGDLYQWGRAADGHESTTSGTTSTTSATDAPGHADIITGSSDWRTTQNDNLWQGVNGLNNPCPTGYRVPTEAEITGLGITNTATAYSSPLKLPLAGYRNSINSLLANLGVFGYYWSSTVSNASTSFFYFRSTSTSFNSSTRNFGFTVRCIKD